MGSRRFDRRVMMARFGLIIAGRTRCVVANPEMVPQNDGRNA